MPEEWKVVPSRGCQLGSAYLLCCYGIHSVCQDFQSCYQRLDQATCDLFRLDWLRRFHVFLRRPGFRLESHQYSRELFSEKLHLRLGLCFHLCYSISMSRMIFNSHLLIARCINVSNWYFCYCALIQKYIVRILFVAHAYCAKLSGFEPTPISLSGCFSICPPRKDWYLMKSWRLNAVTKSTSEPATDTRAKVDISPTRGFLNLVSFPSTIKSAKVAFYLLRVTRLFGCFVRLFEQERNLAFAWGLFRNWRLTWLTTVLLHKT